MATSSVPGTVEPTIDPTTIIPAAHIPAAAATVQQSGGQNNPNVLAMIEQMRKQLDALAGNSGGSDMGDVVLVNPYGRIVEVSGELATEYMGKVGFRRATPDEEAGYRKAILRQTPEYLRRQEIKRLREERAMLDEIEAEDAAGSTSNEDLMRATVTDAQKTGAPAPATPVKSEQSQAQVSKTANGQIGTDTEESTPKPPSRRAKSAQSQANKTENTPPQQ